MNNALAKLRFWHLAALLVLLSPLSLYGDAAKVSVSIKGGFNPGTITIHVGDTVTWTNNEDRDHDVTSDDGSFVSGNLKSGKTFSHTFTTIGKYSYACSLHPREKGIVIVEK